MVDQTLIRQVVELARRVGAYQLTRFRKLPPGGGEEKLAREFVSEVDIRSEQMLIEGLEGLLPGTGFYGEETGRSGDQDLTWIIDPLDGTTNYLSGLDQFCISVALVENGTPLLGIVYRPASQEIFCARRGHGLFRNGEPLPKPPASLPLRQAVIGTGFPYRSADLASPFFACAAELLDGSRDLRRMGSAALDLSYVAAGYLQGFWESDLQPYDVAAALLFLKEQGCTVSNGSGAPFDMHRDRLLVCGPPLIHDQLAAVVMRHYPPC